MAYSISKKKLHHFQILFVTLTFLVYGHFGALKSNSASEIASQLKPVAGRTF